MDAKEEILSTLASTVKKARSLPHLLVAIPKGELTPEVKNNVLTELQVQLNDQHIAEKLGRAFMLGRLHRMQGVQLEGDTPLDTIDECNLYAGGYQYDSEGDNPILDGLLAAEQAQEGERIEKFQQTLEHFNELIERREKEGVTIEIVEEMMVCRLDMMALTHANLISRVRMLEARIAENFGDLASLASGLDIEKLRAILHVPAKG